MLKATIGTAMLLASFSLSQICHARVWTDSTGQITIQGTLLASDDKEVVIKLDKKREDHELLAVPIEHLSQADIDYLHSQEAMESIRTEGEKSVWEMVNGMKVYGRLISFIQRDVTIQRRRGQVYVNDRPIKNLPEVYQKMIPFVVAHFEKTTFSDDAAFNKWILAQRGNPKTFNCEAILLEFPNGDEYAIPLFFLTSKTMKFLQPSYDQWIAEERAREKDEEKYAEDRRQHELYLQSRAMGLQSPEEQMLRIARLQLTMSAVTAGATDLWEVMLYPPPGSYAYPLSVVVPARNSEAASVMAMQRNPGFRAGPVRKVAGY